jgi:cobalt/nickel transport system permease protein
MMHIPDNYLSPVTCAVMGAAMAPVWAMAAVKIKKEINTKKIPFLAISAAFTFLVMMLNVPLPGGTTGHAVGSVLIAILLGPFSACISVTIALLIQALFFGDGGILAFAANCFNMAFIMPFAGYFIFQLLTKLITTEKFKYITAFIASYLALNIAALFAAVEFGLQPLLFSDSAGQPLYCPYPLNIAIPAMLIPHLLVAGIVEGIITVGVFAYVSKTSPGILREEKESKTLPLYLLILGLIVITPLGLLAPGTAWGEWGIGEIKEMLNYVPQGMENGFLFQAPLSDYTVPFLASEYIGYVISALAGAAVLIIAFRIFAAFFKERRQAGAKPGHGV